MTTGGRRTAPDPEFVLLYRQGAPTSTIAEGAGVAATTVRYHLQIAAQQDPGLREEHQAALASPRRRIVSAGRRNLSDVLAFYRKHGRLPGTHEKTPRKRALGMWLLRRRQEAAAGTLSPGYREALAVIPGWDTPSTRKTEDEVRWQQRLDRIRDVRSAGGDWPRHQKTEDRDERTPRGVAAYPADRLPCRQDGPGQSGATQRPPSRLARRPPAQQPETKNRSGLGRPVRVVPRPAPACTGSAEPGAAARGWAV